MRLYQGCLLFYTSFFLPSFRRKQLWQTSKDRKEILMSNTTILQVCDRLEADKQWSTFFDILRDYGDASG